MDTTTNKGANIYHLTASTDDADGSIVKYDGATWFVVGIGRDLVTLWDGNGKRNALNTRGLLIRGGYVEGVTVVVY